MPTLLLKWRGRIFRNLPKSFEKLPTLLPPVRATSIFKWPLTFFPFYAERTKINTTLIVLNFFQRRWTAHCATIEIEFIMWPKRFRDNSLTIHQLLFLLPDGCLGAQSVQPDVVHRPEGFHGRKTEHVLRRRRVNWAFVKHSARCYPCIIFGGTTELWNRSGNCSCIIFGAP